MRRADNLTTFMCRIVLKSGRLNLLEPSGPVQACNEIAFYLVSNRLTNYESHLFVFLPPVTSSVLNANILSVTLVSDTCTCVIVFVWLTGFHTSVGALLIWIKS